MDGHLETYVKGRGASIDGTISNIDRLTTFVLRAFLHCKKFNIATEMDQFEVGKFDDGMVSYIEESEPRLTALFQAKQKDPSDKNEVNEIDRSSIFSAITDSTKVISLPKYIASYIMYTRYESGGYGNIDYLIFFTNQKMSDAVKLFFKKLQNFPMELVLGQKDEFYSFDKSMKKDRDNLEEKTYEVISKEIKKCEICERFADKLVEILLRENNGDDNVNNNLERSNAFKTELRAYLLRFVFNVDADGKISSMKDSSVRDTNNKWPRNKNKKTFREQFRDQLQEKLRGKTYDLNVLNEFIETPDSFEKSISDGLDEFLVKFIMAVGQPNVEDYDKIIIDLLTELPLFKGLNDYFMKYSRQLLQNEMTKWYKEKQGTYLDGEKCSKILTRVFFTYYLGLRLENINNPNLEFEEKHLTSLKEKIKESYGNIIKISSEWDLKLLEVKLFQSLRNNDKQQYTFIMEYEKCIEVDMNLSESIIIMNCQNYSQGNCNKFIEKINKLKEKNIVILLVAKSEGNDMWGVFDKSVGIHYPEDSFCHEVSFNQLTENSKKIVLGKRVNGYCTINELFGGNNDIDNNMLCKIMCGDDVVIGKGIEYPYEMPAAFTTLNKYSIDIKRFVDFVKYYNEYKYIFTVSGKRNEKETIRSIFLKVCQVNEKDEDFKNVLNKTILFQDFHQVCEKSTTLTFWIKIQTKMSSLYLHQIYNPFFYVDRSFKHEEAKIEGEMISEDLRENNVNNFVILCNLEEQDLINVLFCTRDELNKWKTRGRITIVANSSDAFEKFEDESQHKLGNASVHLVEIRGNEINWIKSNGCLDFIRESLNLFTDFIFDEESFVSDIHDSLVIFTGDPGCGKTTTVTSLSNQLKQKSKGVIIRANCGEYEVNENLKKLATEKDEDNEGELTVDFILNFISQNTDLKLNKCTLRNMLERSSRNGSNLNEKLLFIFDALDELSPKAYDMAVQIIKYLHDNINCKIYIAVRSYYKETIEDTFSVFAKAFYPISLNDQVDFLINSWFPRLVLTNDKFNKISDLYQIAEDLIEKVNGNGQKFKNFTESPLYLKFLAELSLDYIIENKIDHFLETDHDFLSLVKHFIDKVKYIYYKEKKKASNMVGFDALQKEFDEVHSEIAFTYLFSQEHPLPSGVNSNILESYLETGILEKCGDNYKFIHRIFCEFYCAKFIVTNLKNPNSSNYKTIKEVVEKELIDNKDILLYRMVIFFLDYLAVEDNEFDKSIFYNDLETFNKLLPTNETLPQCSTLKRSQLYYALRYGGKRMIRELSHQIRDQDIFGRGPLHDIFNYSNVRKNSSYCLFLFQDNKINLLNPSNENQLSGIANMKDRNGKSFCNNIVDRREFSLLKTLIYNGVHINTIDFEDKYETMKYFKNEDYFICFALLDVEFLSKLQDEHIMELLSKYEFNLECSHLFNLLLKKTNILLVDEDTSFPYFEDEITDEIYLEAFQQIIKIIEKKRFGKMAQTLLYKCILQLFLFTAAKRGYLQTFKYALEFSYNRDTEFHKNKEKYFEEMLFSELVQIAIKNNNMEIVKFVWNSFDEVPSGFFGKFIHFAVIYGTVDMITFLCELGMDVNYENENGVTPLQLAAYYNKGSHVMKCLIEAGGNVNVTTDSRDTVLDILLKKYDMMDFVDINCIKYLINETNCESWRLNDKIINKLISEIKDLLKVMTDFDSISLSAYPNRNNQFDEIIEKINNLMTETGDDFKERKESLIEEILEYIMKYGDYINKNISKLRNMFSKSQQRDDSLLNTSNIPITNIFPETSDEGSVSKSNDHNSYETVCRKILEAVFKPTKEHAKQLNVQFVKTLKTNVEHATQDIAELDETEPKIKIAVQELLSITDSYVSQYGHNTIQIIKNEIRSAKYFMLYTVPDHINDKMEQLIVLIAYLKVLRKVDKSRHNKASRSFERL